MSILSGYNKYKRYIKTSDGYKLCSHWTSSNTVHFDDNKTAQSKLGSINGISDSLTSTSSNVAASTAAVKALNDKITQTNSNFLKLNHNGFADDPNEVTTIFAVVNGWGNAVNVPDNFRGQYGLLINVWVWPNSIGDIKAERAQFLAGLDVIASRNYSAANKEWTSWRVLARIQ